MAKYSIAYFSICHGIPLSIINSKKKVCLYIYYNIGEFYKQYDIYMELFISYYRTSKRLEEGTVIIFYPLCRKASQCPNIKKKIKKISVLLVLPSSIVYILIANLRYESIYNYKDIISIHISLLR